MCVFNRLNVDPQNLREQLVSRNGTEYYAFSVQLRLSMKVECVLQDLPTREFAVLVEVIQMSLFCDF